VGLYVLLLEFNQWSDWRDVGGIRLPYRLRRLIDNREMVERVCRLGAAPYSARQATYDLRRLKRKGLIVKIAHTHRYQLTNLGRR
jgi:hypothetical protein